MANGDERWWQIREAWGLVLVVLGGWGYRPRLSSKRLMGRCPDGSDFTVEAATGDLLVQFGDDAGDEEHEGVRFNFVLRDAHGRTLLSEERWLTDFNHAVVEIEDFLASGGTGTTEPSPASVPGPSSNGPTVQMRRAVAFATYRRYLDELAARGIDAYLEAEGVGHRMYADVTDDLRLDISIADWGLDDLGPDDDYWLIMVAGPEGYEVEVMLDQAEDPFTDAVQVATASAAVLSSVLRDQPALLATFDPRVSRLDPTFVEAVRRVTSAWPPVVGGLLPDAVDAYGVEEKLLSYALNLEHQTGGPKAQGFLDVLGISVGDASYLTRAISEGLRTARVAEVRDRGDFGMHCAVLIPIQGIGAKAGRMVEVRTVWELRAEGEAPRLVTAYVSSTIG